MNFSQFFIQRPIFAAVLSLLISPTAHREAETAKAHRG